MTESIGVVRRVYAALADGDLTAMIDLTAEDVVIDQTTALPYGGHFTGHEGLRQFVAGVAATLDSKVEVHELFVAGEKVVQVGRTRGTARATGLPFDAAEIHVWGVRDGRIRSLEAFVDTDALLPAITGDAATVDAAGEPPS